MAKKKREGSNLGKNPMKRAMDSAIINAATISAYVLAALYAQRLFDIRILALYTYLLPIDTLLQLEAAELTSDTIQKIAATKVIATTQKGLQPFVRSIFRKIDNIYNEGTLEYNRLLIGGAKSFYHGSRAQILQRFTALILAIGADASLVEAKAIAQAVVDNIHNNTTAQTGKKQLVGNDSMDVKTVVGDAAKAMWYVYCGLIMVYINTPLTALTYFPMTLIYRASKMRTKTMIVPKSSIKKILMHLFKTGETVYMKNNGLVALQVGLAESATSEVLIWYTLLVGQEVTIPYALLGNANYKFVMVKNADMDISGDITFTINGI